MIPRGIAVIHFQRFEIIFKCECREVFLRAHGNVFVSNPGTVTKFSVRNIRILLKGKLVPVRNLIKHYVMKAYGDVEIDPHFLDLGTSWR
jgi:hypothetical protein